MRIVKVKKVKCVCLTFEKLSSSPLSWLCWWAVLLSFSQMNDKHGTYSYHFHFLKSIWKKMRIAKVEKSSGCFWHLKSFSSSLLSWVCWWAVLLSFSQINDKHGTKSYCFHFLKSIWKKMRKVKVEKVQGVFDIWKALAALYRVEMSTPSMNARSPLHVRPETMQSHRSQFT